MHDMDNRVELTERNDCMGVLIIKGIRPRPTSRLVDTVIGEIKQTLDYNLYHQDFLKCYRMGEPDNEGLLLVYCRFKDPN